MFQSASGGLLYLFIVLLAYMSITLCNIQLTIAATLAWWLWKIQHPTWLIADIMPLPLDTVSEPNLLQRKLIVCQFLF